ncbi:hypothetical protein PFY12_12890 [Chryseobacterium camelliae]|uniref:Uncharacterized protein n=1 Tax=Chryseobacterium camelliae TaxID=1265445 RepID=A0ABY7QLL2_9FLAO|nr:hypothetical protein [Chryseobacterium camelliae]WBV59931.1 hypothetical protein PFY12_12890 [Chryseobacterium camelliae]
MKNYLSLTLLTFAFYAKLQAQTQDNLPVSFPIESSMYNRTGSGINSNEPPPNSPLPPPLKLKKLEENRYNLDSVEYKREELEVSPETAEFRRGAMGNNPDMFSQLTTPKNSVEKSRDKSVNTSDYNPNITLNNELPNQNNSWQWLILLGIICFIIYLIRNRKVFIQKHK